MTIKDYKCKCGHDDFFFADKGNQKGIYCSYCGKWYKWADKDEQNLTLMQEPCEGCEYKLRGEVEQKTGYWEKATDKYCYWYKCSCCGTKAPKNEWGSDYFSPYCPECGARMVEPQERSDKE